MNDNTNEVNSEERNNFSRSVIWDNTASPCKYAMQSMYYSSKCKYVYILILIITVILGIWSIVDLFTKTYPGTFFYILEFLINIIFLIDICIRIWLNGFVRFWRSISNIIEVVLVCACVILSCLIVSSNFILLQILERRRSLNVVIHKPKQGRCHLYLHNKNHLYYFLEFQGAAPLPLLLHQLTPILNYTHTFFISSIILSASLRC